MASFAAMDHITFDYEDESIKLATTFEQLAHLDTTSLESYMILACNKGRLSVDNQWLLEATRDLRSPYSPTAHSPD